MLVPGLPLGPDSPTTPVSPGDPDGPAIPLTPIAPGCPTGPALPEGPGGPGIPLVPTCPVVPEGPVAPGVPVGPVLPVEPGWPGDPLSPVLPAGPASTTSFFLSSNVIVTDTAKAETVWINMSMFFWHNGIRHITIVLITTTYIVQHLMTIFVIWSKTLK